MTLSKNSDLLHKQQSAAAKEQFKYYKDFIVSEFITRFGGSYQTAEQHATTWRKTFDWTPKREEFLKSKTRDFLNLLPNKLNIYDSPKFCKVLIRDICDYLAIYICRCEEKNLEPGEFIKQRPYSDKLFQMLFTDNKIVQNRIQNYNDRHKQKSNRYYKEHRIWVKNKKQEQQNEKFRQFAQTGEIPETGIPLHSKAQHRKLLIELYGSDKVRGN